MRYTIELSVKDTDGNSSEVVKNISLTFTHRRVSNSIIDAVENEITNLIEQEGMDADED